MMLQLLQWRCCLEVGLIEARGSMNLLRQQTLAIAAPSELVLCAVNQVFLLSHGSSSQGSQCSYHCLLSHTALNQSVLLSRPAATLMRG